MSAEHPIGPQSFTVEQYRQGPTTFRDGRDAIAAWQGARNQFIHETGTAVPANHDATTPGDPELAKGYRSTETTAVRTGQEAIAVWLAAREQLHRETGDTLPTYTHEPKREEIAPPPTAEQRPALADPTHPLGPNVEVVPFDRRTHPTIKSR